MLLGTVLTPVLRPALGSPKWRAASRRCVRRVGRWLRGCSLRRRPHPVAGAPVMGFVGFLLFLHSFVRVNNVNPLVVRVYIVNPAPLP